MKKIAVVLLCLLAAGEASAATSITPISTSASVTFIAPDGTEVLFFVNRQGQFCDLSCTTLGYSFCINPVPGCLEGSGYAPDASFQGNLTGNPHRPDQLKFQYDAVTNTGESDLRFLNIVCNSFDNQGNCTSETVLPNGGGLIELTFTKTPIFAILNSNIQTTISNGTSNTFTGINDLFSALAVGSLIGIPVTLASHENPEVAFAVDYNKSTPASKMLGSALTDAVRWRIEVLERKIQQEAGR